MSGSLSNRFQRTSLRIKQPCRSSTPTSPRWWTYRDDVLETGFFIMYCNLAHTRADVCTSRFAEGFMALACFWFLPLCWHGPGWPRQWWLHLPFLLDCTAIPTSAATQLTFLFRWHASPGKLSMCSTSLSLAIPYVYMVHARRTGVRVRHGQRDTTPSNQPLASPSSPRSVWDCSSSSRHRLQRLRSAICCLQSRPQKLLASSESAGRP